MTQERIRRLLSEAGGEATLGELRDLIEKHNHSQLLVEFLQKNLQLMENKGIVRRKDDAWVLTEVGRESSIEYRIDEIDAIIDEDEIHNNYNITVANIVGSVRLNRELDLKALSEDLSNTEYDPETYSSLIYRPERSDVSVLTPSSGRLAIVGAKSKEELTVGIQDFLKNMSGLGIDVNEGLDDILIPNIVATFDTGQELDLSAISIALGLENIEYEPEQFPGLIYRLSDNSIILLFNSGKCVITGAKTYFDLIETQEELIHTLSNMGIEVSTSKNHESV